MEEQNTQQPRNEATSLNLIPIKRYDERPPEEDEDEEVVNTLAAERPKAVEDPKTLAARYFEHLTAPDGSLVTRSYWENVLERARMHDQAAETINTLGVELANLKVSDPAMWAELTIEGSLPLEAIFRRALADYGRGERLAKKVAALTKELRELERRSE